MSLYDTAKNLIKSTIPTNLTTRESYNSNSPSVGTGQSLYDALVGRHNGKYSYHDYKTISQDYQVKIALQIVTNFLLSKNYIITSNSDDEEDVMIADFIQEMLDNLETPLRGVRKNVYTAIKYGYSVHERVYKLNTDGKIVLSALYPLHMKTLQSNPFKFDDEGNLTHIHQQSTNGSADIEIGKILLYSFDAEFDELQGNSLLNELDDIVRPKKKVLEWLITFLHKNENPVMYGKTRDGKSAAAIRHGFDEISGGKTNITVNLEDEIGILESNHRGEGFFNAINLYDNIIMRRMFIGNLLMGDGGQTGSYSQSSSQMEMTLNIFNGIHEDIAACFQGMINEIVEWNFGSSAKAPNFKFESFIGRDYLGLLQALQPYCQNMLIDTSSPWFEELISTAVQEQSGIKVDKDKVTDEDEDADVDYAMNTPIPGDDEANNLINQII